MERIKQTTLQEVSRDQLKLKCLALYFHRFPRIFDSKRTFSLIKSYSSIFSEQNMMQVRAVMSFPWKFSKKTDFTLKAFILPFEMNFFLFFFIPFCLHFPSFCFVEVLKCVPFLYCYRFHVQFDANERNVTISRSQLCVPFAGCCFFFLRRNWIICCTCVC